MNYLLLLLYFLFLFSHLCLNSFAIDLCSDQPFSTLLSEVIVRSDIQKSSSHDEVVGQNNILFFSQREVSLDHNLLSKNKYHKILFRKFSPTITPPSSSSSEQVYQYYQDNILPSSLPSSSVSICLGVGHHLGRDSSESEHLSSQLVSVLTKEKPRVIIFSSATPLEVSSLLSVKQHIQVSNQKDSTLTVNENLLQFVNDMLSSSTSSPVPELQRWRNEKTNSYWIELFSQYGYELSVISTSSARNMAFSLLNQQPNSQSQQNQEEISCEKDDCFLFSRLSSFARNSLVFYPKSDHSRKLSEQIHLSKSQSGIFSLSWFNMQCSIDLKWLPSDPSPSESSTSSPSSDFFNLITMLLERDRLEYLSIFSQYKSASFDTYLHQLLRTPTYSSPSLSHSSSISHLTSSPEIFTPFCLYPPIPPPPPPPTPPPPPPIPPNFYGSPQTSSPTTIKPETKESSEPIREERRTNTSHQHWKELVVDSREQQFLSKDQLLNTMKLYTDLNHIQLLSTFVSQLNLIQKYHLQWDTTWIDEESKWVVIPFLFLLTRPEFHLSCSSISPTITSLSSEEQKQRISLCSNLILKNSLVHELGRVVPGLSLELFIDLIDINSDKHNDKHSDGYKLQVLISPRAEGKFKDILRRRMNEYRLLDVWNKSSL